MSRPAFADRILWTLWGLMLLQASSLYAGSKPLILVELKVEAQDFRDNLAKVLDNTQREGSLALAKLLQERFSFYEWRASTERDRAQASAVLIISLKDGDLGPIGKNIYLTFTADIRDKGAASDRDCNGRRVPSRPRYDKLDQELYSASAPQPTGKKEILKRDIFAKISALTADGSSFRSLLATSFFQDVPFCREAEPVANLIAINLTEDELNADEGSEMKLILCSRPPEELRSRGRIDLRVTEERATEGKYERMAQASPGKPQFGGFKKPYSIAELLTYGTKGTLDLLMVNFHKRPENTSGQHANKGTP